MRKLRHFFMVALLVPLLQSCGDLTNLDINEDPDAAPLRRLAQEIDDLRESRAEPDLERFLVYTVGVDYGPQPLTYKEWLGQIADRLRQHAVAIESGTTT